MQRHGALKRPLRSIIKSIGGNSHISAHPHRGYGLSTATRCHSTQDRETVRQTCTSFRRLETGQLAGDCEESHRLQLGAVSPRTYRSRSPLPAVHVEHHLHGSHRLRRRHRAKRSRAYSTAKVAGNATREAAQDGASTSEKTGQAEGEGLESSVKVRFLKAKAKDTSGHTPSFEDIVQRASTKRFWKEGARDSEFDHVIRRAENRPSDGVPRVKEGDKLKPRYFKAYHSKNQDRLQKSFRRWQIFKERHYDPSSDDWRRVLALLEDATPSGEEHFKKRIEDVDLPKDVRLKFKDNASVAILEIMQRTGSHVQIEGSPLTNPKSTGDAQEAFSSMSLLGTPQQNSAALKILPQYVDVVTGDNGIEASRDLSEYALRSPDKSYWDEQDSLSEIDIEKLEDAMDQLTKPTDKKSTPAIRIRAVWADDRVRLRPSSSPDHFLRRPEVLSTRSLDLYMETLTQKLPGLVIMQMYSKERPKSHSGHVDVVTKELESLLTDEAVIPHVSASSLNRALQFLTKHSKFHVFRKIFSALEDSGFGFAVSNWNVLLAAAAKAGDVFNFRYILRLMIDRQTPPTPTTWALFHDLMTRRFALEAGVVVETMRKKGLLIDNQAASLIAANSAGNDLTAHLALKGDLPSFYKLYDNRFGLSYGRADFEWLNINVVNRICGVLLTAGRRADAYEVINDFRTRHDGKGMTALETDTLNIFLTSAFRDGSASSAVAMLRQFRVSEPGAMSPDHITYTILFGIAWRRRYYNMVRVIWRYACMAGHASFMMQSHIRKSLFWHPATKDTSVLARQMWMNWAGKFTVGVHEGLNDLRGPKTYEDATTTSALSLFESNLVRLAGQPRIGDEKLAYSEHRNEVGDILRTDYAQVKNLTPVYSFTDVLQQAFRKDVGWEKLDRRGHEMRADEQQDFFAKMMQHGIRVPVRVGDYTRGARDWEVPSILFNKRYNERA